MIKKILRTGGTVILITITFILLFLYTDFLPQSRMYRIKESDIYIDIPKNTPVEGIVEIFLNSGLIKSKYSFYLHLFREKEKKLQAGYYKLNTGNNLEKNINIIMEGKTVERYVYFNITIPEGFSSFQIAEKLQSYHVCSSEEFLKKLDELVKDPGFKKKYNIPEKAEILEGFLFPDTYRVRQFISPDIVISMMLHRFNQVFSDDLKQAIKDQRKDFYKTLIIASLIEKETGYNEHKLVSSVIHNRLKKWYMLQIDATILYALGPNAKNITLENKFIESPYNTYTKYGLPPTPICNPGLKSIEAAIFPADTVYLYYVSKNDGTHAFSINYEQHKKNVNKYQKNNFKHK